MEIEGHAACRAHAQAAIDHGHRFDGLTCQRDGGHGLSTGAGIDLHATHPGRIDIAQCPTEVVHARTAWPHVHRPQQLAAVAEDVNPYAIGRLGEAETALGLCAIDRQRIALRDHLAANEVGTLQGLPHAELIGQALQGLIDLLDPGHGVDLGHLGGHLGVVQWVQRVLVVELGNEQP